MANRKYIRRNKTDKPKVQRRKYVKPDRGISQTQIYVNRDCDTAVEVQLWDQCYNIEETTYLNYNNNGDITEIPPEIGLLVNLTSLTLSNIFVGAIPPEIGNLTNLTYLNLGYNQLTGEIPSEIGNLINLEVLDLSHNQLTGEIPSVIGNLTNLIRLDLSWNQLTGEIPSEIGNLMSLTGLWLSWNQLTGEIPAGVWGLTNLENLDLEINELIGELPPEIGNLINLEKFSITENGIGGPIPPEIGNMVSLRWFYAEDMWMGGHRYITGDIPSSIGNLTNLERLLLGSNRLGCFEYDGTCITHCSETDACTGELPPEIGNLINLEELDLRGNLFLSGQIPETICNLDDADIELTWNSFCLPYPECPFEYDVNHQDWENPVVEWGPECPDFNEIACSKIQHADCPSGEVFGLYQDICQCYNPIVATERRS